MARKSTKKIFIGLLRFLGALLVVANLSAQEVRDAIGPIEKQANPITPENPIPRLAFSVAPVYPAEAASIEAVGAVSLIITIDDTGRVVEIRKPREPLVITPQSTARPSSLRIASEAVVRESASALRRWTYDAPARGPVVFTVTFSFGPGAAATSTQSASVTPVDEDSLRNLAFGPGTPNANRPVRVGSISMTPTRVKMVPPIYPPGARAAGVSGVVVVEVNIGVDGKVREATVLRSVPLLDQAALDAVRQWEYEPSSLYGVPIPVIATATVVFTLN
jgi:TonB family protein